MSGAAREMSLVPALRWLRLALEVLGLAFAGYVAFMTALVLLAAGWRAQAAFALGYLALVAALFWRRRRSPLGARLQLDLALVTLVPAFLLAVEAVDARWPIRGRSFDAHGWGVSGGEPNALFLSWLHAALWLALAAIWARARRAHEGAAGTPASSARPR